MADAILNIYAKIHKVGESGNSKYEQPKKGTNKKQTNTHTKESNLSESMKILSEILQNIIWGQDINPEAITLCKIRLNLWYLKKLRFGIFNDADMKEIQSRFKLTHRH